jgi:hypothetical protein
MSVGPVHSGHMQMPRGRRWRLALAGAMIVGTVTATGSVHALSSTCVEPSAQAQAAALKPSDVLLAISTPRAGETVLAAGAGESLTFSVDYWGPRLVPADSAHAPDEYHLVYLLDEDASPYIGTLRPMPICNPHIMHSAATHVTFDGVAHGSHGLAVLLAGSNNVSVNPPVAARVTFTVK